jgi:adenylate cyclase
MSRCADAFVSAFVQAIGTQSREKSFTDQDIQVASERAMALLPTAVQTMDVLLRRHLELRSRPDPLVLGEDWAGVDAIDRAIGFCDLVGFTRLSQQITTEELAHVLSTFESLAFDLITAKGGQVVKLIGDEVMYVALSAQTAAVIALELTRTFAGRKDVPPVRVGISFGRVVAREGDYFGPVVNLAARIVKLAEPGTVLAPLDVVDKIEGIPTEVVGAETLKGFDDPVDLVALRP